MLKNHFGEKIYDITHKVHKVNLNIFACMHCKHCIGLLNGHLSDYVTTDENK